MNIKERFQQKTPRFFRRLRNISIAIAAGAGALLSAPISLPASIVAIATYLTVAGTVATAVSQAVVSGEKDENDPIIKEEDIHLN
jgi:acyl-CoA reductase-like NAD-dependent aldehyde dehydrogenase